MSANAGDAVHQQLEQCVNELNEVAQKYKDLSIGAVVCHVEQRPDTESTLRQATLLSGIYAAIEAAMNEAVQYLVEQMRLANETPVRQTHNETRYEN